MFGEPAPRSGQGDVWQEIIENLPADLERVKQLCIARREMGIQKYGTPLQYNNGRNPRKDLREELLDASVYARQAGLVDLSEAFLYTILAYQLETL